MPPWCAAYCYNTEKIKGLEIQVSDNNTDEISGVCVSKGFQYEPDRIRESNGGAIIWVILTLLSF